MFDRWGAFVVRRAWWVIGGWLVGALLVIGLLPGLSDITSGDQGSFLPDSYESVQAIDLARTAFPEQATSTAIVVVTRSDGGELTQADQDRVGALSTAIAGAHIAGLGQPVTGPQAVAPNKLVQLINVPVTAATTDAQGQMDAVQHTRDTIRADLEGSGLTAGVAGTVAQLVDNNDTFNTAFTVVGSATFLLIIVLIL